MNIEWTAEYIAGLPDSSFAYIEPGGRQVEKRTRPNILRHFPYKTAEGVVDSEQVAKMLESLETYPLPSSMLARAKQALSAAAVNSEDEDEVEKKIRQRGDKWVVTDDSGKKVLGTHDSKAAAVRQLAAIESAKKTADIPEADLEALRSGVYNAVKIKKIILKSLQNVEVEVVSKFEHGTIYRVMAGQGEMMFNVKDGTAALMDLYMERPVTKVTILKQAQAKAKQYTLGVVYPVKEVDAHGDFMSEDELEKAAWRVMRKDGGVKVGLMHKNGTGGSGAAVESYIYRGPEWTMRTADGTEQTVHPGDWLLGTIWSEEAWKSIEKGEITGYSLQGLARKEAF